MAKKSDGPLFGGFLDFNRNGKLDMWELWIAHQMLKESLKPDTDETEDDFCLDGEEDWLSVGDRYSWRETCLDGSEYGVFPELFETELEYLDALEEAQEEMPHAWRFVYDEEYGVSPEDYETEEEFLEALEEAKEEQRYAWRSAYDELECGISPEEFETEEEYLNALADVTDIIPLRMTISFEWGGLPPELSEEAAQTEEKAETAQEAPRQG